MKNETRYVCPKCNGDYSDGFSYEDYGESKIYVGWQCPHCEAVIEEVFVLAEINIKED